MSYLSLESKHAEQAIFAQILVQDNQECIKLYKFIVLISKDEAIRVADFSIRNVYNLLQSGNNRC